jgi:hypothetical protein
MSTINAQYNVAAPDSLPVRIAGHQRRKMYGAFLAAFPAAPGQTLVDVGVTSDRSYEHSNYLVAWYPHKAAITAVGLDDARFLEVEYPGVRFVRADGRDLPFEDGSYDIAHSSAVLEHVGSAAQQTEFLRQLWRVARRGIFVTTPNRWFPVEFHTVLPLVHWLPKPVFRSTLHAMGKDFFAEERNLNLIGAGELRDMAIAAGLKNVRVDSVSLGGWPTNLLLTARK